MKRPRPPLRPRRRAQTRPMPWHRPPPRRKANKTRWPSRLRILNRSNACAKEHGSTARALRLFLPGRFRPPKLLSMGPVVRTQLMRTDRDDEGLVEIFQEADFFQAVVEADATGAKFPEAAACSAGVATLVSRAM